MLSVALGWVIVGTSAGTDHPNTICTESGWANQTSPFGTCSFWQGVFVFSVALGWVIVGTSAGTDHPSPPSRPSPSPAGASPSRSNDGGVQAPLPKRIIKSKAAHSVRSNPLNLQNMLENN